MERRFEFFGTKFEQFESAEKAAPISISDKRDQIDGDIRRNTNFKFWNQPRFSHFKARKVLGENQTVGEPPDWDGRCKTSSIGKQFKENRSRFGNDRIVS